jgi:nitrite reductase (cytochrome c-552)
MRVTDHRAARPDGRVCGTCHKASQDEMKARLAAIQERTDRMMSRGADALVALLDEIKRNGATDARALEMQRKAQLRLDFVRADGSRGFHAPQEALRLLGEAIDYARQGQVSAAKRR